MSRFSILFFTVAFMLPTYRAIAETCPQELAPKEAVLSNLQDLYDQKVLTVPEVEGIRDGKNPLVQKGGVNERTFAPVVTAVIENIKIHPEARIAIDEWIREIRRDANKQAAVVGQTKELHLPLRMNPMPQGKFKMYDGDGIGGGGHWVTIAGFRAANILVTQWQYSMVMKKHPSFFVQANNPVENVSWRDVKEFLAVLNHWSQEDNPLIYQIIQNHIKHARIRLLKEAEWEYLVRDLGKSNNRWVPEAIDVAGMHNYMWTSENSNGITHPVAELLPFIVNGEAFYDLQGNVSVWLQDPSPAIDEYEPNRFIFRGPNYDRIDYFRSYVTADEGLRRVGLRLAEDPP